jgi:hypothetical protein
MSVSLICPSCGTPVTIHRAPVSVCHNCQAAFPEALRLSAEAALAREKIGRPLLLTIGMYVAPTFGGFVLLFTLLAPLNVGHYTLNGEVVTGLEFLKHAGLLFIALGATALAAAYAIWKEHSWSRWAIMAFWLAQLAGALGTGWSDSGVAGAAGAVASLLLALVLVGWYLFGKENVVEYYRALAKGEAAVAARRASGQSDGA